jgi:ubiquinone biosynthesis protein
MNAEAQSQLSGPIERVMVGTDRSQTAERAVRWAATFAEAFGAELHIVQVIVPSSPADTEYGAAEATRARSAADDLQTYARSIAGDRAHGHVVIHEDPAMAIVEASQEQAIDVLVVGNAGMAGRKEFLLGNVPNRISHNASCTVIIVNTMGDGQVVASAARPSSPRVRASATEDVEFQPRLTARGGHIAAVFAKHGLKELFGRPDEEGAVGRRRQGKRLRAASRSSGRRSRSSARSCPPDPTCCRPSTSKSSRRCRTTYRPSPRSRSCR